MKARTMSGMAARQSEKSSDDLPGGRNVRAAGPQCRRSKGVKSLGLYLAILLLVLTGSGGAASANDNWDIGENRIDNSDFEGDNVGGVPQKWALKKDG